MNVNGWGVGKFEDICEELYASGLDLVGLSETHLRERQNMTGRLDRYRMITKGRSRWTKAGGGVALLIRNNFHLLTDEIELDDNQECEDILCVRIEYNVKNIKETVIVCVCYMTTEGTDAARDNRLKYSGLMRICRRYENERVIVMGDMNGHIGLLGENVNNNGRLLLDFADESNLEILNLTMGERCATWHGRRGERSAIDYFLVN